MKRCYCLLYLVILGVALTGCSGPPVPRELDEAGAQELGLWRIGGPVYTPQAYERYAGSLAKTREALVREQARPFFLRDYRVAQAALQGLLKEGERLREEIEREKRRRAASLVGETQAARSRLEHLRQTAAMMNEGYRAGKSLTKADLAVTEAELLSRRGELDTALTKLHGAQDHLNDAQRVLAPIVTRYSEREQIAAWRKMVAETVSTSHASGGLAIVVNKVDRRLTVYRGGVAIRMYPVGLGRAGFSLKRYAGDQATPEGQYSILKKVPASRYYRALLINYPNEEDRRKFQAAKRRGSIPGSAGIGGLVEIHGGGTDGMTYGCIALDNPHMAELFDMVDVGTRVTIVGSTEYRNPLSSAADRS